MRDIPMVRPRGKRVSRAGGGSEGERRNSGGAAGRLAPGPLRRLASLDAEGAAGVRDAGQGVAILDLGVFEHLLVVVLDEVLGGTVGDPTGTGDTLALPAGVREVPALIFALVQDRLVVGEFDGLALLDELDLEVLDLVFGDVAGPGAARRTILQFTFLAFAAGGDRPPPPPPPIERFPGSGNSVSGTAAARRWSTSSEMSVAGSQPSPSAN